MPSDEFTVGCQVTLKVTTGEEISGVIFAYDTVTGIIALKQPGSHGGVTNVRLIRGDHIQEVVKAAPPEGGVDLALPHVDIERARQRELKALQQAESDLAKIGEGVTKEAQSIFDALAKTMPCKWQGKSIVVMEAVLVEPPYSTDSCTADEGLGTALARVQKVLQAERQRLGLQ